MDAESLAEKKSAGSISLRWLWLESIQRILNLQLAEHQVICLIDHASAPKDLLFFAQLLEEGSAHAQTQASEQLIVYFERIDASGYSPEAWMQALATLAEWLKSQNCKTDLSKAIGYLTCSIEATQNDPTQRHLSAVVLEMLQQYGFDGGG